MDASLHNPDSFNIIKLEDSNKLVLELEDGGLNGVDIYFDDKENLQELRDQLNEYLEK